MEHKRNLLLVDDEKNILGALSRVFRKDGYEIFRADGGQAGLELLQKEDVGVIISDQRMPGMTGVEFLSQVKELYPDTVRIVLSGYTDLQSITDAINEGAIYKFLTKPWDDDLIRNNVREAFERYELKKENERLSLELKKANEKLQKDFNIKSQEAGRNLHILQVSQEVLENLPVAVLGVGDDGLIAIANKQADALLNNNGGLVGNFSDDVLPAELLAHLGKDDVLSGGSHTIELSGGKMNVRVSPMGETSASQGYVVVINRVHEQ